MTNNEIKINEITVDSIYKLIDRSPTAIISDSFVITNNKLKNYDNIAVSISGGSDSDIMLDIIERLRSGKYIRYVWFDTGLEYQATKNHLDYLEKKYHIQIDRVKAIKPIPLACRQYGQPFLSKKVSDFIKRLQAHNFKWEDEDFDILYKKYPKCKAALRWWCNKWGENSRFNISYNKWLKEFMIANPPQFKISDQCCEWAKKKVVKRYIKLNNSELNVFGVRKAEGGARATAYKTCFSSGEHTDEYRPIFWYKTEDKEAYEQAFNITHSKCYSCYGLERTGCAGCPFGKDFEKELEIIREYEPKLYIAVNNIFGNSYEYTRKYIEFVKQMEGN